jgi:hypothetical protein
MNKMVGKYHFITESNYLCHEKVFEVKFY